MAFGGIKQDWIEVKTAVKEAEFIIFILGQAYAGHNSKKQNDISNKNEPQYIIEFELEILIKDELIPG